MDDFKQLIIDIVEIIYYYKKTRKPCSLLVSLVAITVIALLFSALVTIIIKCLISISLMFVNVFIIIFLLMMSIAIMNYKQDEAEVAEFILKCLCIRQFLAEKRKSEYVSLCCHLFC